MDGNRFDSLTRALGSGRSRRSVVKGLGKSVGAAALGALGLSRLGSAEAAQGGNSACAHFCKAAFPPGAARGECVSDAAHGTGTCVACGADINNFCSGACTTVATDVNNCGSCGNVCPPPVGGSATCAGGSCGIACPTGTTYCSASNACITTATDVNNCGSCGNVCPSDVCTAATCSAGVCGVAPTNEGGACNGTAGVCSAGTCFSLICSPGLPACSASAHNGGPCPQACFCETSVEGTAFCTAVSHCEGAKNCASNSECPSGQVCITGSNACFPGVYGCPEPFSKYTICVALCGQPAV